MSARAGEEIPKKNESKPIESTTPLASGSEGVRRTGINWGEVLGRSPRKVAETSYAQAKEQTQRKEAELSPEALDLAKDNFGELVYLLLKKHDFITNNEALKNLIKQLSPELGKLFYSSPPTSLSADEVVRKIQQEIGRIFTDDDSLSEQEKRIRETHRQQLVIIGLAFQEYKMQAITSAYSITPIKEEPELSTEEELTQNTKQKLRRPENVLVLDEEGRIIPQGPELSEEEFVNAHFKKQPVSFLNRILGRTEEVQRSKAAKEYQRYRKLLEEQEGKKTAERRLRFEIKKKDKTQLNGDQNGETQPKKDPDKEFLLRELGLMEKNSDDIREEQVVLSEIMAQIRADLTLRQEILTATGISGEQLFNDLTNLSQQLPKIPSLDQLKTDSLDTRIKEIIKQRQTENAKRVKEELEKTERRSTISQLRIRERELNEQLNKINKREAQDEKTGKKTQPVEGGQISIDRIKGAIENRFRGMGISELLKKPEGTGEGAQELDIGSLLQQVDSLSLQIAGLEAELEGRKKDFDYLERLRTNLAQLLIMAGTKSFVSDQGEKTETQIIDQAGITNVIQKIEEKIRTLAEGEDGLDKKIKDLAQLKKRKAILDNFLNIDISINGETKKAREWLRELERLKSLTTSASETSTVSESRSIEEVESELYAVRALIDYYSEDALSEREQRILQNKDLEPNYVFTDDHLTAIASRNPELYELLPEDGSEGKNGETNKAIILFVLYQAFGDKFIYPDDPNAPEVKRIIAVLQAMKNLRSITSINDFDKKMRDLVNEYLLKKRSLESKIEQKETKS